MAITVYNSAGLPKTSGASVVKEEEYFRKVGTTDFECEYLVGASGGGAALSTGSPAIDVIHAFPFIVRKARTVDNAYINVTTLAALGVAKILVFDNTSDIYPYPNNLLTASSEFSTASTGVKTIALNYSFSAETMYWIAYWPGVLAPAIRSCITNNIDGHMLGFDNTLPTTNTIAWDITWTYSSVSNPGTAPGPGAATRVTVVPVAAIFVRYSA